jgi:arginyl-tRNA synthetase
MLFEQVLREKAAEAITALYGLTIAPANLVINPTRKEFEGDLTLVVFGIAKQAGKSPDLAGQEIGNKLKASEPLIDSFNYIKGFLNISFNKSAWLQEFSREESSARIQKEGKILVEYSSPNTNKPLHLGHVRNNLLGYSV